MMNMRTLLARPIAIALCAALGAIAAPAADAKPYPEKPLRFVAAFPAGGGVDLLARTVGRTLSERLGQSVVVENRAGAAGAIGTAAVIAAPADGYTVLVTSNPSVTIAEAEQSVAYKPMSDLLPIVKASVSPSVIGTTVGQPYQTMTELIEAARKSPGTISYATPGNGSTQHIEMVLMQKTHGIELNHVPYRGAALVMIDVLGGQVPVGVVAGPVASKHLAAGFKPMAVFAARRSPILPDAQTFEEAFGKPTPVVPSWFGFLVREGTAPEIVATLEREILEVLRDEGVRKTLNAAAMDIVAEGAAEFRKSNEIEARLIREALNPASASVPVSQAR
jgi:tripartite-type tricarboxylate transporter receptor subunit TctC